MTPTQLDIARRLKALADWDWTEGMLAVHSDSEPGGPYVTARRLSWGWYYSDGVCDEYGWWKNWKPKGDGWLPDLTDWGTAGVLLGMLPGDVLITRLGSRWRVLANGPEFGHPADGPTLAQAAALALLAVRGD